ncbi:hypothetical protein ONZ45_g13365 [Pleurotus djamor]|nr:hypothetical protein ONZ45_g13365 [Pleurotus djamor]
MVATASPAAQNLDAEQRRKLTIERAKANHLSCQLQLRLQYAKLKIEHGWMNGTKPQTTSASVVATAPTSASTPASDQSAMSFKLGSTSFTISSSRNDDTREVDVDESLPTVSTTQTSEARFSTFAMPSTRATPAPSDPAVRQVAAKPQRLRPQPTEIITHPSNPYPAPWPSPPLNNPVPSSSSLYYRSATLSSAGSKTSDTLRLSSASLTYDSFWSSMGSTSSGSSARASTASMGQGDAPPPLIPAAKIVQGGYRRSNGSRPLDKES